VRGVDVFSFKRKGDQRSRLNGNAELCSLSRSMEDSLQVISCVCGILHFSKEYIFKSLLTLMHYVKCRSYINEISQNNKTVTIFKKVSKLFTQKYCEEDNYACFAISYSFSKQ
jgi:hypothetical protein